MKKYLIYILLLTGSITVAAQQKAVVEGRVYDKTNNKPIEFASVVVMNTTTGNSTDSLGHFRIENVKPGFVRLQVALIGYQGFISDEFMVNSAKPYYIEIGLVESNIALDGIVISPTVYARSTESPLSVRRLGQSEIEKSAGANRDISKVIQTLPGVAFTSVNRNDVIVRGGGSNENRYFLDGVELPYINHFTTQGASGGVVGIINPDFIRNLNFYSGAFPSNKGNALSSVLDFRQIDGNSKKMNFKATVGASDLAFAVNGPVSRNTTLMASVRRSYLQLLFSALKLPFLPTYNDFQFKVKTKINPKNELTFIGIGAYDDNKLNTGIKNPDDKQSYLLNYLPASKQWTYTVGAVYRHYAANGSDMVVLSRNMLENKEWKYPYNDESQPRTLDYSSTEAENKLRYEREQNLWRDATLNAGAGAEYDRYQNSTYRRVFYDGQAGAVDYQNNLDFFRYGFFAQLSQKLLNERLGLSFGIRADGASYSSKMQNPIEHLSPRFSASYALNSKLMLNFNTGRYQQLPPYTAMGYGSYQGEPLNEAALEYITADHLVAGFNWLPSSTIKLSVEGFYKHYRNYPFSLADSVVLAAKGGSDFGVFGDEPLVSIGEGRAYGMEVLFRTSNLAGISLLLSYTLFWSEYNEYTGHLQQTGRYVPSVWDNRQLISLVGSKEFRKNWTLGAKWRLGAGTPYTPYDKDKSSLKAAWDAQNRPYLNYSLFNRQRLGVFHQLDLRVDKVFYFNKWMLGIYIDVQNVYNFKSPAQPIYTAVLDVQGKAMADPADPQRYLMKEINADSGTILPTIGIVVEF